MFDTNKAIVSHNNNAEIMVVDVTQEESANNTPNKNEADKKEQDREEQEIPVTLDEKVIIENKKRQMEKEGTAEEKQTQIKQP